MVSVPGYQIDTDPLRGFVRVSIQGFMDTGMFEAIERDFGVEMERMWAAGCEAGQLLTLLDLSGHELQTQDIAERAQASSAAYAPFSRKLAVILPASTLHRMQIRRVSQGDNHQFFTNEEDALNWLFAES